MALNSGPSFLLKDLDLERPERHFHLQVDSLSLGSGLYVITGPNGAGKSTLLEACVGLHARATASVEVNGNSLLKWRSSSLGYAALGFAPQQPIQPLRWTLHEYLRYSLWLKRVPRSRWTPLVERICSEVELRGLLEHRLGKLSGGLRRRALFAQALVHEPNVVVLDEPCAGLDARATSAVIALLRERAQRSVVLVSDHGERFTPYASTVLGISDGNLSWGEQ